MVRYSNVKYHLISNCFVLRIFAYFYIWPLFESILFTQKLGGWHFICFSGKWVLTKDYIINSAESGRWLDETTYEWGYKIKNDSLYSPQMQSAPKRWREKLSHSGAAGAFHRWNVVLFIISGDKREDSLIR